ncbi:MAG: guanylate kinase [Candidatus Dormiibacterota bacterium]
MNPGLLIVLSGPGGVGKDTVIERLRELNPRLRYSVSYTTRPRRDYERQDEHYTFVDRPTFKRMVEEDRFLEHAIVNGHCYGTSAERVERLQQAGDDVILKIEVQGAEQVRARRLDGVFVFLAPPSMEELLRRRLERGAESPEEVVARQQLAAREMSFVDRYDHVVVNDDLERAVGEIESILAAEREARDEPARER